MTEEGFHLTKYGKIAETCWLEIPDHFTGVGLDEFVVMPNHIHGIIGIMDIDRIAPREGEGVRAQHAAPLPKPHVLPGSLGAIVRSYKSAVTKKINEIRGTPGARFWQRNHYEHIVRNEKCLEKIRDYIRNNPARWDADRENPARARGDNFDLWLDSFAGISRERSLLGTRGLKNALQGLRR